MFETDKIMLIQTPVKKIHPNFLISATFEHQGVGYEERFNSMRGFKMKLKRTKDAFKGAVDYEQMRVIHPLDVKEYIN